MNGNVSSPDLVNALQLLGVGEITFEVHRDFENIEQTWNLLESNAHCTVYQKYDWIHEWTLDVAKPARISPHIVVGSVKGEVQFILPFGVRRRGPFVIASWLGDSHTNFHMAIYSNKFQNKITPAQFRELVDHVIKLLPDPDVLEFCCQPVSWQGATNPFSYLQWQESHNQGFALNLDSDFNTTLDRKNGSRKRKKFRWQQNKLADVGGAKLRVATTPDEVNTFVSTALDQLKLRFNTSGIWNRFADEGIDTFFTKLALNSLEQKDPIFQIFALEIDGKIRATFAGGTRGAQFSSYFISTSKDEYSYITPGEMIIYLVIEECVKRNYTLFDLGRGEERYKTSWCDKTIVMFETNIALTRLGAAYSGYERLKLAIKRVVRNNQTLWELAKKVRTSLYGRI